MQKYEVIIVVLHDHNFLKTMIIGGEIVSWALIISLWMNSLVILGYGYSSVQVEIAWCPFEWQMHRYVEMKDLCIGVTHHLDYKHIGVI